MDIERVSVWMERGRWRKMETDMTRDGNKEEIETNKESVYVLIPQCKVRVCVCGCLSVRYVCVCV